MNSFTLGSLIGVPVGLAGAYYLYTHSAGYQQMIDWQFSHPLVLVPAAIIGVAIAIITD